MKLTYHIFFLALSVVGFFLSNTVDSLEFGVILSIIYFYMIVKELRGVKNGFLLPSFFLSFFLMFEIVWGVIPMKYNWFGIQLLNRGAISEVTLNQCVYVTMTGISAMWISFSLLYKKVRMKDVDVTSTLYPTRRLRNSSKLVLLLLIGLLVVFLAKGMFGYFGDSNASNYTSKLYYFALLIPSFYFLYTSEYDNSRFNKRFYAVSLVVISAIGLMSGAKALMIIPITVLVFIKYIHTGVFFNKTIIYLAVTVVAAFLLIIPIRDSIRNGSSLSKSGATELVTSAMEGQSMAVYMVGTTMSRMNYVTVLSNALEYHGPLHQNVEKLWQYSLLSPFLAFMPRSLFPDKPTSTFANWYAHVVCGSTEDTNMSASYPGILYLAGGLSSVILGFLLVGIVLFIVVKVWLNDEYIYIYLSQFLHFAILPAEPWIMFVTIIQNVVLFYIFHHIISKRI